MILRLTSKSFAGISRKLVAVGTSSDASMLATMRAPLPLITVLAVFAPGVAGAVGVGRGGVAGAVGVGRGGGAVLSPGVAGAVVVGCGGVAGAAAVGCGGGAGAAGAGRGGVGGGVTSLAVVSMRGLACGVDAVWVPFSSSKMTRHS